MRFHTQTAGVSLTAQQPENNIVRTALEALAAVLGGTQSLHTNSWMRFLPCRRKGGRDRTSDAADHCPRDRSGQYRRSAGRVVFRRGADRSDGGSCERLLRRIDELGGVLAGIDQGFFQSEIADAAFHYQRQLDSGEKTIVGVNDFVTQQEEEIPLLKIDPAVENEQVARLREVKARRDNDEVRTRLSHLEQAAMRRENSMPYILDAVRAYATVEEVTNAMKAVYGTWREPVLV